MRKFILFFIAISLAYPQNVWAQDDELDALMEDTETEAFFPPAFKAMRIVNLQSTKLGAAGELYMNVAHRFGLLSGGFKTFFGLDNASTRIELSYGVSDKLQVGISRESVRQTYAGQAKYGLLQQSSAMPINLTAYAVANINGEIKPTSYAGFEGVDRLSYAYQLLMSRGFNDKFSLELAPTFIRQNLVYETGQEHNQVALGLGGRVRISQRVSFNADYTYNFSRVANSRYVNPLSLGIDLETGGHVFQMMFTNAQSTNEPGFMTNATGDWSKGEIFFGFNLVRVF